MKEGGGGRKKKGGRTEKKTTPLKKNSRSLSLENVLKLKSLQWDSSWPSPSTLATSSTSS